MLSGYHRSVSVCAWLSLGGYFPSRAGYISCATSVAHPQRRDLRRYRPMPISSDSLFVDSVSSLTGTRRSTRVDTIYQSRPAASEDTQSSKAVSQAPNPMLVNSVNDNRKPTVTPIAVPSTFSVARNHPDEKKRAINMTLMVT